MQANTLVPLPRIVECGSAGYVPLQEKGCLCDGWTEVQNQEKRVSIFLIVILDVEPF